MINCSIITDNISHWERALRLFEKTSGMTTSLYLPDGRRVLGPFATSPFGELLTHAGVFNLHQAGNRAELEELIPINTTLRLREKRFADIITVMGFPIIVDNAICGVVFAGWIFDHFADPIECDRLGSLFGISGMDLWQVARMQAPVSREKLKIYEEMMTLLINSLTDQMVAMKELKETSRVKDEVLALVSHELKTPLTSLLLRVQMLKANKVSEDKMENFMNSMEDNALIQTQLVEDLIDAAKITANKLRIEKTQCDLRQVLESSIDLITAQAQQKNIKLEFKHIGGDYRIEADPARLLQIFSNILSNCLKFTPPKGNIVVSLERSPSTFIISFKDSGIGIDKNKLETVFERFYQDESPRGSKSGLGLGLYIVKKIVELHKGTVNVSSRGKNHGTNIVIELPITPASELQPLNQQEELQ